MKLDIPAHLKKSNLLYHFTKSKTAMKKILKYNSMRFNLIVNTNDPRENKYWTFTWNAKNRENIDKTPNIYKSDNKKIIDKFKYGCKVLCFTVDDENYFDKYPIDRYPFDKNPESIFAKGFARSRMWSQYAEDHKGLCIIINKDKFKENINKKNANNQIFEEKVVYKNFSTEAIQSRSLVIEDIIDDEENTIKNHIIKHYKALFFEKVKDYSNEYEYRWILKNNNHRCEYVSIKNTIHAIIIGELFPLKYKKTLIKYCKLNKIPLNKIKWYNGMPYISDSI